MDERAKRAAWEARRFHLGACHDANYNQAPDYCTNCDLVDDCNELAEATAGPTLGQVNEAKHQEAKDQATLEAILDRLGPGETVQALASIFYEKAEHIAHTWQDESLAQAWRDMADHLEEAGETVKEALP